MKNLKPLLFAIGLTGLVFGGTVFSSCSTGTSDGETNVEDSSGKDVHEKSGNDKNAEGVGENKPGADQ